MIILVVLGESFLLFRWKKNGISRGNQFLEKTFLCIQYPYNTIPFSGGRSRLLVSILLLRPQVLRSSGPQPVLPKNLHAGEASPLLVVSISDFSCLDPMFSVSQLYSLVFHDLFSECLISCFDPRSLAQIPSQKNWAFLKRPSLAHLAHSGHSGMA